MHGASKPSPNSTAGLTVSLEIGLSPRKAVGCMYHGVWISLIMRHGTCSGCAAIGSKTFSRIWLSSPQMSQTTISTYPRVRYSSAVSSAATFHETNWLDGARWSKYAQRDARLRKNPGISNARVQLIWVAGHWVRLDAVLVPRHLYGNKPSFWEVFEPHAHLTILLGCLLLRSLAM